MRRQATKILLGIALLLAVVGLAWWAGFKYRMLETKTDTQVSLILEKVEKVLKLVAVEGHVAEIFDHKEYNGFDIGLFTKKALIRVNAKVSVGYDLEGVDFVVDEQSKTVTISDFPAPEVLSIDHDLDYYDVREGVFNTFTTADYNKLNRQAKEYARNKVVEGELFDEAEAQKNEILDMLRLLLEGAGYTLVVDQKQLPG